MTNPTIILTGITPEDLAKVLEPMIRTFIQEEIKAALELKDDKLLSPREVCEKFVPKISKTTLADWTKKGLIEKKQIGGKVFYLFSEIVEKSKTLKRYEVK